MVPIRLEECMQTKSMSIVSPAKNKPIKGVRRSKRLSKKEQHSPQTLIKAKHLLCKKNAPNFISYFSSAEEGGT